MKNRPVWRPGRRGTRRLAAEYGKRLRRRRKTAELIMDEVFQEPRPSRTGKNAGAA
jgi:hypothetical protein